MIEIAISLAVIGFALVAIIGILPTGMNVQKENREETIIGQDEGVILDAIRSGAKGMDDLTNYVDAITNFVTEYTSAGKLPGYQEGFTYTNSTKNSALTTPLFPIFNGYRIVGLLSRPKYVNISSGQITAFRSNYVVAYVRSMSGPASEKVPQTNQAIREFAFNYRLSSDVVSYASYDPNWTNFSAPGLTAREIVIRSNYWRVALNTQTNLYDIRLLFRWPLLANGDVGPGRQAFRALVSGSLTLDNTVPLFPLYFFEPRNYVKAPLP